jgi:hypothetical protein
VIAAALWASGCVSSCTRNDDVAEIQVLPPRVWAVPGATFTLRARLIDRSGYVLPDERAAELSWKPKPGTGLRVAPPNGSTTVVTTPSIGEVTFPVSSQLTVALGSGPSVIVPVDVGPAVTSLGIDWGQAKHAPKDAPVIVLVDGATDRSFSDTLIAFVGQGPLDYLKCQTANCGEITLFSRTNQLWRHSKVDWKGGCELVDYVGSPDALCTTLREAAGGPRRLPVTVYNFGAGSDLDATIQTDIAFARKVLTDGWTGLNLSPPTIVTRPSRDVVLDVQEPDWKCPESGDFDVRARLVEDDGIPDAQFQPGNITIAYVGNLVRRDGIVLEGWRGYSCPWSGRNGGIVLVSWSQRGPTTLAHELAHAIGPWQTSPWGHTNAVEGFSEGNILWPWETDFRPTPRSLLTLGQSFRMSLDAYALFNRTSTILGPGVEICQQFLESTSDTPCPRLTKDVTVK